MLKNLTEPREIKEAMLSLLPTSGTLAGIGIGLVGLINSRPGGGGATLADELLLLSALGFLLVCYLVFFAMRSVNARALPRMLQTIDILFLLALTLLVFSGFVVVYRFI